MAFGFQRQGGLIKTKTKQKISNQTNQPMDQTLK